MARSLHVKAIKLSLALSREKRINSQSSFHGFSERLKKTMPFPSEDEIVNALWRAARPTAQWTF
jgi:hypothetical protein